MPRTVRIEFEQNWQPRKLAMMEDHFRKIMAVNGAPKIRWQVLGEEEEPEVELYLHVGCTQCAAKFQAAGKPYRGWLTDKFTPCAIHGRAGMVKMQEKRVPQPKGVGIGQPVDRHMAVVNPAPPPQSVEENENDVMELLKDKGFGEEGHMSVDPVRLGG